MSNALFDLSPRYQKTNPKAEVESKITGRVACDRIACKVIAELVSRCEGDHLEIGTLFGGTAIVAALAREDVTVHIVDPFAQGVDRKTGIQPSKELLFKNLEACGVREQVKFYHQESHPLPVKSQFDTVLIDGNHTLPYVFFDWINVMNVASRYVIFDNVDKIFPDVSKVFRRACATPLWRPILLTMGIGVLERYYGDAL